MNIFYEKEITNGANTLSEEESRHCAQVLRHDVGDDIMVFDGDGGKHHAVLTKISKKSCEFDIKHSENTPRKSFSIHLAIAPTKSTDRIEWMIEKLCEIGVDEVSFIETHHSERRKMRLDRMEKKIISAMKQSGNPFKMKLNEIVSFESLIKDDKSDLRYFAHVSSNHQYLGKVAIPNKSYLIMIGPEGDFSEKELNTAVQNDFIPISLGKNTLRTETAGFVGCNMINTINQY